MAPEGGLRFMSAIVSPGWMSWPPPFPDFIYVKWPPSRRGSRRCQPGQSSRMHQYAAWPVGCPHPIGVITRASRLRGGRSLDDLARPGQELDGGQHDQQHEGQADDDL